MRITVCGFECLNSFITKKFILAGFALAGVTAGLVFYFCDPVRVPIFPPCLFHRMTGLDCPGCGATRAIHHLLHGEVMTALHFNAFLILSLPLFAGLAAFYSWRNLRGQSAPEIRLRWVLSYFTAFVAFGILRELPFPLCAAFAP